MAIAYADTRHDEQGATVSTFEQGGARSLQDRKGKEEVTWISSGMQLDSAAHRPSAKEARAVHGPEKEPMWLGELLLRYLCRWSLADARSRQRRHRHRHRPQRYCNPGRQWRTTTAALRSSKCPTCPTSKTELTVPPLDGSPLDPIFPPASPLLHPFF